MTDLLADVRARHVENGRESDGYWCGECGDGWPCDAAKLAALLTPERLAAALRRVRLEKASLTSRVLTESDAPAILAALTSEEPTDDR